MKSPCLNPKILLPPATTAMYCLPSIIKVMGGAFTPASILVVHNSSPVFALKALKLPLPSPLKTKSPAVESVPPIRGSSV